MINPDRIKAGDLFSHKNKKTYFFLGAKSTCVDAGMYCKHFINIGLPLLEPCTDYLYAFLIDGSFCWVSLKDRDWQVQFKKVA
jgi:hypothetical protein